MKMISNNVIMKNKINSMIIKEFVKLYQSYLWCYLFITGILLVVCYLYNTLIAPIIYAISIYTFIGCVLLVLRFFSFIRKYIKMQMLINNLSSREIPLPQADTVFESFYQDMIQRIKCNEAEEISKIEDASRARDDYFTMWVHQIKTPIAAMNLLIHEIGEQKSKEEIIGLLPPMEQEMFKTEQYAEMVLQYLRMEQMEKDLSFHDSSLKKIIHGVVKKYSILFIHKRISLELGDLDTIVLTDEKWCEFIIEQLLSNAIKYSKEKGKIKIYVDEYENLIIEDQGIGILKEDIPRIFERGFTGFNGRMYKKATGLGLFLCKRIADKLSIHIVIESEVAVGTKVMLEFPKKTLELF